MTPGLPLRNELRGNGSMGGGAARLSLCAEPGWLSETWTEELLGHLTRL